MSALLDGVCKYILAALLHMSAVSESVSKMRMQQGLHRADNGLHRCGLCMHNCKLL